MAKIRSNPIHVVGRPGLLGSVVIVALLLAEGGRGDKDGWRVGRATYYGENHDGNNDGFSIHHGSCQFGKLDPNVGTGWDIAAIPDAHPDYQGSCGKCYELACEGMIFTDNYGESIDRRDACRSESDTVIVTVVDSCPCKYAQNMYSNQRWCCGDMDHFDISIFAFEKLASMSNGVIGLKYRPVPCPSYEEFKPTDPNMVLPHMKEKNAPTKTSTRVSRESSTDSTPTKVPPQPEGRPTQGGKRKDTGVTLVSSDPLRVSSGDNETGVEEEPEPKRKSAAEKARELAKKALREEVEKDQPNRAKALAKKPVKKKGLPPPPSAVEKPQTPVGSAPEQSKPAGESIVVTGVLRPPKSKAPKATKENEKATGSDPSLKSGKHTTPGSRNGTSGGSVGELGTSSSVVPPSVELSEEEEEEEEGGGEENDKPAGVLTRLSRSSSSDTTPTRGGIAYSGPVESRVQAMVLPTIVSPQTVPASVNVTVQELADGGSTGRNGTVDFPNDEEPSIVVKVKVETDKESMAKNLTESGKESSNGVVSGSIKSPVKTPSGSIKPSPKAGRSDVNGTKSSMVEKSTKTKVDPKATLPVKPPVKKPTKAPVKKPLKNVAPTKSAPPVPTKPKTKDVSRVTPVSPSTAAMMTNVTTPSLAPPSLPSKESLKCSPGAGPVLIFEGGFDDCFVDGGLLRYTPINSNGFGGRSAWCSLLGPRRSVAAVSLGQGVFEGKRKLDFYLFVQHGCPDIALYLVGKKGACGPINVKDQNPVSERSGYKKFSINLDLSEIEGCALNSAEELYAISFKNNLDSDQGVCLEEIKLY